MNSVYAGGMAWLSSAPVIQARVGSSYRYDADALDPDDDPLAYAASGFLWDNALAHKEKELMSV